MPVALILDLARNALVTAMMLAGPLLGTALVIGLVVSIVQAVTSIQEQTLTFVPKIAAILLSLFVFGPWMMSSLAQFATRIIQMIPDMAN